MSTSWNLPDGCTPDDIDVAQGASRRCWQCRRFFDAENDKCPHCTFAEEQADYLRDRRKDAE
jgi:rRNA maturation endonuclease Nob1